MNTIPFIIMLLALALLAVLFLTHFRREEVINAEETEPGKDPVPPALTPQEIAAAEIAETRPSAAPKGVSEKEIAAKVAVGLTRDQAIQVINNQNAEDAAAAKAAKKKA